MEVGYYYDAQLCSLAYISSTQLSSEPRDWRLDLHVPHAPDNRRKSDISSPTSSANLLDVIFPDLKISSFCFTTVLAWKSSVALIPLSLLSSYSPSATVPLPFSSTLSLCSTVSNWGQAFFPRWHSEEVLDRFTPPSPSCDPPTRPARGVLTPALLCRAEFRGHPGRAQGSYPGHCREAVPSMNCC